MIRFDTIPITDLYLDENIRHKPTKLTELAESIKRIGLIEPLIVKEIDGKYQVVDGSRRYLACKKAGLTEVPSIIRDDYATDAMLVEAQLAANIFREDLSAQDEAHAFERLALEGMDDASIAKIVGFKKAHVAGRRKLLKLPADTQAKVFAGQMTIEDAEIVAKFANDPEGLAYIEKSIGTYNLRWKAQEWPRVKKERAERAREQAELKAKKDQAKEEHRIALAEAKRLGEPAPVKPEILQPKAKAEPKKEQWEIDREKRAERNRRIEEQASIAAEVRVPFVQQLITTEAKRKIDVPDTTLALLRAAYELMASSITEEQAEWLGLNPDEDMDAGDTLTAAQLITYITLAITKLGDHLTNAWPWIHGDGADVLEQLTTRFGYQPSDAELELAEEHKKQD